MTKVYGDYDQAALDAQYNLRPLVPHNPQIFERYIRDSALVADSFDCELDLAYGPASGEKLDIIKALNPSGPAPVHVFIHGGYWRGKDKTDYRYIAPAFCHAGIHFVAVNYTLAPTASMDEIVRQNRAAVAWVAQNIDQYGGDPARIHISGHSAGGHLVAMLMATDWAEFSSGILPGDIIRGSTAISGLFDLEPIQKCYLNESLRMDAEEAERNSAIHLRPLSNCPLILALGGEETSEYHRQQTAFETAWRSYCSEIEVIEMPGLNHYDVIDHLGMPGSALFQAVTRQIMK